MTENPALSTRRRRRRPAGTPLILGVTGGIACGKSLVISQFAALGAAVVSADALARLAVRPGAPALQKIADHFGPGILTPTGELDRPALARRIFADPAGRAALNRILHPVIGVLARRTLKKLAAQPGIRLIVYEAPLLFEARAEGRVDQVLVVTIKAAEQLARLMRRDNLSREEAQQRIQAQMSQDEKVARADLVLDNSGPPEQTAQAVAALFEQLALPKTNPPLPGDQ